MIRIQTLKVDVQLNGFSLLTTSISEPLAVGSWFEFEGRSAYLFQWQMNNHTALWLTASDWQACLNQTLDVSIQSGLTDQPDWTDNQLWLASGLAMAWVFDAMKRWQVSDSSKGRRLALLHSSDGFAFQPKPARYLLTIEPQAIGACTLLEDWGVPNRLASEAGLPGCLDGDLDALYQAWLAAGNEQSEWRLVRLDLKTG